MKNYLPLVSFLGLPLALSHCSQSVRPYSEKREAARIEAREQGQSLDQLIYEEGRQAGQRDRTLSDPDSYRRHSPLFTPATEKAFADGYRDGYGSGDAQPSP